MRKWVYILIIIIVLSGVAVFLSGVDVPETGPTSFDECAEAGNPVMESYPRQCRLGNKIFIEEIPENEKVYSCPSSIQKDSFCTQQYEPVCAVVNIQCFTTPCNPIEETYSNICEACRNSLVDTYTKGECSLNK